MEVWALLGSAGGAAASIMALGWFVRGWLADLKEELLKEIQSSRHLLRGEMQTLASSVDTDLDNHGQRIAWLEAKTNGKH